MDLNWSGELESISVPPANAVLPRVASLSEGVTLMMPLNLRCWIVIGGAWRNHCSSDPN